MNYIFFDVECANCFNGKGKICSFGFVCTDEKFNIITKEDKLMNPKTRWDFYVLKKIIHYKKEDFFNKPTFQEEYESIKYLLTNPNHIIFGFDVSNDLKYIIDDCKRYGLSKIIIKSYDIQSLYKKYFNKKNKQSLTSIAKELDIDISYLLEHNSRDDSEITMLIMKEIANRLNISSSELISLCEKY